MQAFARSTDANTELNGFQHTAVTAAPLRTNKPPGLGVRKQYFSIFFVRFNLLQEARILGVFVWWQMHACQWDVDWFYFLDGIENVYFRCCDVNESENRKVKISALAFFSIFSTKIKKQPFVVNGAKMMIDLNVHRALANVRFLDRTATAWPCQVVISSTRQMEAFRRPIVRSVGDGHACKAFEARHHSRHIRSSGGQKKHTFCDPNFSEKKVKAKLSHTYTLIILFSARNSTTTSMCTYIFSFNVVSSCPIIFHTNICPSFDPAAIRLISRLNETRDQSQPTLKLSLLQRWKRRR